MTQPTREPWWVCCKPSRSDLVVLAVAAVLLALLTADVVAGGLLTHVDRAVRDATAPAGDPPAWTRVVGVLGNAAVTGAAALVAAVVTMQVSWRWWPGVLTAGVLAVTGLVVVVLKYAVGRDGPQPDSGTDSLAGGYPGYFPSGHTATAAVGVGTIVLLLSSRRGTALDKARHRGLTSGAVAGLLVATSSVLGGFHWLSDVAASLVIAWAVLTVAFAMAQRYVESSRRRTTTRRS